MLCVRPIVCTNIKERKLIFALVKLFFNILILWLSILKLNAQTFSNQATWQQKVDYDIQVELNPVDKTLFGKITITYYNNSPSQLDFLYILLWPNAYSNKETPFAKQLLLNGKTNFHFSDESYKGYINQLKFTSNGNLLQFDSLPNQNDVVKVMLNRPLSSGSSVVIETPFFVKLPYLFSRGGYEKNNFFSVTQWYPKPAVYDVNGWHPMSYLDQGEFYSEFGKFNVEIVVPDSMTVAATGNLIQQERINSKRKYQFEENNIHDFAWFASPHFITINRKIVLDNNDTVKLEVFNADEAPKFSALNKMEIAIRKYSEMVGHYPYKTCKLVLGGIRAGDGMEYPTITICNSDQSEVIIHEVGHNWFYGILASNERQYPWMDESINSYFDKRITSLYDTARASEVMPHQGFYNTLKTSDWTRKYMSLFANKLAQSQGISQAINLRSEEYAYYNYGVSIYGKGPLAFAFLNQYLGDSVFLMCFKQYFKQWQYKHPLPGDIQNSFETTSGKDLKWFFNDVLKDNFDIDIKHNKNGFYVKGSEQLDQAIDRKTQPNSFGFLAEKSFYNNHQKRSFIKLRMPFGFPTYNKVADITVTPFIGYNVYDGLYPLLAFHNAIYNQRKVEYLLMPAYSIKEQSLIGYGNVAYTTSLKSAIQRFAVGLQSQVFGINTLSNYNRYYRVHPYIKIHFGEQLKLSNVQSIELHGYHTGLIDQTYTATIDTLGNTRETYYPNRYFFNYLRAMYSYDNGNIINRMSLKVNVESGANNKNNPGANSYLKTWVNAIFKHQYKKKKYFRSEAFVGLFLSSKGDIDNQKFFISSNSGNRDYTYSDALMGRAENRYSNLFVGRQILQQGGIRNLTDLEPSDRYLMTLSNDFDFPGVIPAALYFDVGYYQYMHRVNNANVGLRSEFIFTGGVSIKMLKRTIEIFVPIVMSNQFKAFNQLNSTFLNTIGFKINLNQLYPISVINRASITGKTGLGEQP